MSRRIILEKGKHQLRSSERANHFKKTPDDLRSLTSLAESLSKAPHALLLEVQRAPRAANHFPQTLEDLSSSASMADPLDTAPPVLSLELLPLPLLSLDSSVLESCSSVMGITVFPLRMARQPQKPHTAQNPISPYKKGAMFWPSPGGAVVTDKK